MKKVLMCIGLIVSGYTYSQIIPPTGTSNYTLTSGQSTNFYDPSGPGGNTCGTGPVPQGNYQNCGCFTTVTINAAVGEFLTADFNEFSMWNTTSGWDWMRIYDGPTTGSAIIYDNSSTGANNPFGDCGIGASVLRFCATGRSLTFQFWASSVVNRAGWDATVESVNSACGLLPIELISFGGVHIEDYNKLDWVIETETNNEFFTIERSGNLKDWYFIDNVEGAHTIHTPTMYEYRDYTSESAYYRLSQTDFDGHKEYFSTIFIDVPKQTFEIPTPYDSLGNVINEPDTYIGLIIYKYKNGTYYKLVRLR